MKYLIKWIEFRGVQIPIIYVRTNLNACKSNFVNAPSKFLTCQNWILKWDSCEAKKFTGILTNTVSYVVI